MTEKSLIDILLMIMLILFVLSIGLICIVFYQKKEIKDLLCRRNSNKESSDNLEEDYSLHECKKYCKYKDELIPELRNDVEIYKDLYRNEQKVNSILESTNAKLRLKNMEEK